MTTHTESETTETFPCSWLVEIPTASLHTDPEDDWYPDSPADVYTVVECGADARIVGEGWACDHGHRYLGLEAESHMDWQREQAERAEYQGRGRA